MSHPDPYKMTVDELKAHGCERCMDALKFHDVLDQLIDNSVELEKSLTRLQESFERFVGGDTDSESI